TYTAGRGLLTSAPARVTVTVLPVNYPPSFQLSTNIVYAVHATAAKTITNFATNISPGRPTNEANQKVSFLLSSTTPKIFAKLPAVSTNGTLTFQPSASINGQTVVTLRAEDNGSVANGG